MIELKIVIKKAHELVAKNYRPIEYTRYSVKKGEVIKVKTIKRKPRKWSWKIVKYRQCMKEKLSDKKFISIHGPQRAMQIASKICVAEIRKASPEAETAPEGRIEHWIPIEQTPSVKDRASETSQQQETLATPPSQIG